MRIWKNCNEVKGVVLGIVQLWTKAEYSFIPLTALSSNWPQGMLFLKSTEPITSIECKISSCQNFSIISSLLAVISVPSLHVAYQYVGSPTARGIISNTVVHPIFITRIRINLVFCDANTIYPFLFACRSSSSVYLKQFYLMAFNKMGHPIL